MDLKNTLYLIPLSFKKFISWSILYFLSNQRTVSSIALSPKAIGFLHSVDTWLPQASSHKRYPILSHLCIGWKFHLHLTAERVSWILLPQQHLWTLSSQGSCFIFFTRPSFISKLFSWSHSVPHWPSLCFARMKVLYIITIRTVHGMFAPMFPQVVLFCQMNSSLPSIRGYWSHVN